MELWPLDQRDGGSAHLLATLERLLRIDAPSIPAALQEASDLLAETLHAEKTDAFVYQRADDLLVAVGTSHTPLGRLQHALGLHRLPLSAAGRTGWVFATHTPFRTGRLEQDPWELRGVIEDLGIHSTIATPLDVGGTSYGVLQACSPEPERFTAPDLQFLSAVALWLGLVAQRADVRERGGGTESGTMRHLLTRQQTLALLEDQLAGSREPRAAHPEAPDALWQANLLRWKIRQLEEAMQETDTAFLALQGAFLQSQQELSALRTTVTELAIHQATVEAHQTRVTQEAARVRRAREDKLRQAEATIAHLEAHLQGERDAAPDR